MRTHEDVDIAIAARAARHEGSFTHTDALAAGLSEGQITHRIRSGRWVASRPGVYVVAGAPATRHQALWVAAAAHPGACVSGPSAAWLWGLPKAEFERIHLLTDDPSHARMVGVVGHRSRVIVPADRREIRRVPVTSPARTIIDCSGTRELRPLIEWWIDHCIREELLRIEELQHCRNRLRPARGRNLRLIDAALGRRGSGFQPGDSEPEIRIADWLEAAGLGRPLLGEQVWLPGEGTPLKPDGLYLPEKVGFEYQSWAIHGAGQAIPFHEDQRRLNKLRTAGFDLYAFTADTTEAEAVEVIAAALARARRRARR